MSNKSFVLGLVAGLGLWGCASDEAFDAPMSDPPADESDEVVQEVAADEEFGGLFQDAWDECASGDDGKACLRAAIMAEFEALEANKKGDRDKAQRLFRLAERATERACELGEQTGCDNPIAQRAND